MFMRCENCGSTDLVQIASGLFRCLHKSAELRPGPGWGAPPTGQFGPLSVTVYGPRCGHITDSGATNFDCHNDGCDFQATRRCETCQTPICAPQEVRGERGLCRRCGDEVERKGRLEDQRVAELAAIAAGEPERRRRAELVAAARAQLKVEEQGWGRTCVQMLLTAASGGAAPPTTPLWDPDDLSRRGRARLIGRRRPRWQGWEILPRNRAGRPLSIYLTVDGEWLVVSDMGPKRLGGIPCPAPADMTKVATGIAEIIGRTDGPTLQLPPRPRQRPIVDSPQKS